MKLNEVPRDCFIEIYEAKSGPPEMIVVRDIDSAIIATIDEEFNHVVDAVDACINMNLSYELT